LFSNFRLESIPQFVVVSGLSMGIPLTVGFRTQLVAVSSLLVGIPLTVGFRPQLVVVSGLLVGIPWTVGFRPQLVVVSGLLVGIPLTVGFRLSQSIGYQGAPFSKHLFLFLILGYYRASFTNVFS
jgi:hypothetical protein